MMSLMLNLDRIKLTFSEKQRKSSIVTRLYKC